MINKIDDLMMVLLHDSFLNGMIAGKANSNYTIEEMENVTKEYIDILKEYLEEMINND